MSYCRKAGVACYDSNQGKRVMREKLNSTFQALEADVKQMITKKRDEGRKALKKCQKERKIPEEEKEEEIWKPNRIS